MSAKDGLLMVAEDRYHADARLGSSDVKALIRSPSHFMARDAKPDTPAMALGRCAHAFFLEPETAHRQFRPKPPDVDGHGPRTNRYKDWLAAQDDSTCWMNEADYYTALDCADAAMSHPVSKKAFEGEWVAEGTVFFEIDGVGLKARPDLVALGKNGDAEVIDLKTTVDASPEAFRKQMGNLMFHVQEWLYRKALESIGFEVKSFTFLAVEKSPPFGRACYSLSDAALQYAGKVVRKALRNYSKCKEADEWPGYSDEVSTVELPPWVMPPEDDPSGGERAFSPRHAHPSDGFISVQDAMVKYGVSRTTLYAWRGKGVLTKKFAGRRMFAQDSLESVLTTK